MRGLSRKHLARWGGALLLLAVIILLVLYGMQRGTIAQLVTEEIRENNFNQERARDALHSLKPQTINVNGDQHQLNAPEGFSVSVYAANLGSPRKIAFDTEDNLYVTDAEEGHVVVVEGESSQQKTSVVDQNLNAPHGIAWHEGTLFVATERKIISYSGVANDGSYNEKSIRVSDLPGGGENPLKTLRIGPEGDTLFVSVGADCNVCDDNVQERGVLMAYDLSGANERVYAQGLKNMLGFEVRSVEDTQEIWGVDRGREHLGKDIPPAELNRIEPGSHYGWPFCYGDGIADPEFPDRTNFCRNKTKSPEYQLPAHSKPWGLAFVTNAAQSTYPKKLQNAVIMAYHGSNERTVPTGYKLEWLNIAKDSAQPVTLVSGWLTEQGNVWGTPVALEFAPNGDLYVSDDKAGVVYRITYEAEE
ncbi:MAG: hypothetical protein BRC23_02120 [Parcubacteria group bacterium SW_4_49_11]|nr:MAG: hypothetical protein BRC23_02120 [Parcubacteria group bacterium SW_4_49_11]